MEGSLALLGHVGAWKATEVGSFVKREKYGGHLQKRYEDTYGGMIHLGLRQIIGNILQFIEQWAMNQAWYSETEFL